MKKNLIAVAVAALTVIPTVSFAADTKVYGRFNIGLDRVKDEIGLGDGGLNNNATGAAAEGAWRIRDMVNSSRLGFKGKEDVGLGDLAVIYQLEYGIDPDGSEGAAFSQRNIFVGLTGGFGTVKFGKYDTLIKDAGAKVDQFNDQSIGDITFLMVGENRENNLISYSSPKIAEMLTLNAAVQLGERRAATDNAADFDKGLADTFFLSADFESGIFFATLAYADNDVQTLKMDGLAGVTGTDQWRLAAGVKMPMGLELGALYQVATGISSVAAPTGDDREETSYLVSAAFTVDAFKFKGQYGKTDADVSDNTRDMFGLGVDYKLSKALTTQVFYMNYSQDAVANMLPAGSSGDTSSYGLAMIYSF